MAAERRRPARHTAPWACLIAALALPVPAWAYTCARVQSVTRQPMGPSLRWPRAAPGAAGGEAGPAAAPIAWSMDSNATTTLDRASALGAAMRAFSTWQQLTMRGGIDPQTCVPGAMTASLSTDITFEFAGWYPQSFAGYNYLDRASNRNMIIFHDHDWPYESSGHSNAIALTVASVNVITGEIFDADIEVNSQHFNFSVAAPVGDNETDLIGTLTHEVGHVLGFGHSLDVDAVMYKQAAPKETKKRELACDDAILLAYRYPAGAPTNDCLPTDTKEQCGDCQPPSTLANEATITKRNADTGMLPNGCRATSTSPLVGVVALVAGRVGWRRLAAARRRPPG